MPTRVRNSAVALFLALALGISLAGCAEVPGLDGRATGIPQEKLSLEPAPIATPTVEPIIEAAPVAIDIPAVGMSSPMGVLNEPGIFDPGEDVIIPVWLGQYGKVGGSNTVYIGGHSWRYGSTVFNGLFDLPNQVALVHAGDGILLTTDKGQQVCYLVESAERVSKDDVASPANPIWVKTPGRLVLMTCFLPSENVEITHILVVVAQMQSQGC